MVVLAEYLGRDGPTVAQLSVGESVLADIESVQTSALPGAEPVWRATGLRREASAAAAIPRLPHSDDRDHVALAIVSILFQAPFDLYVVAKVVRKRATPP